MKDFASALKGGDRRSIGRADAVAAEIRRNPARFDELWKCLVNEDALVRMRAADALEKLSRENAQPFETHKKQLLAQTFEDGTKEMRWHLVAISSRLTLTLREARLLFARYDHSLRHDVSRIVKATALQSAADLASKHVALDADFRRLLVFARKCPWPSVRARARKLDKNSQSSTP